jgi:AraC-like DNA-binding protein
MTHAKDFKLSAGLRPMLADLGVNPVDILRHAGLPDDLLARPEVWVSADEYFRIWAGAEAILADPALPIRVVELLTAEAFEPPVFAALCSPNLSIALARLAHYKPLVAPMVLSLESSPETLRASFRFLHASTRPPSSLAVMELAFVVRLARMGTRERVHPLEVVVPERPPEVAEHERYFGVRLSVGEVVSVCFARADAERPFLTANPDMWAVFEPQLRRRLAELDGTASLEDRVRAALLEALPSGQSAVQDIAARLGASPRTLQRKLQAEGTSYKEVLRGTREQLARHYLVKTQLPCAEISFLLGFEEPNSFFRAFREWTGDSPERVRQGVVH